MRFMTGLLAVVLLAGSPLSAPAASFSGGPAPADEYFGPHHQSILEIRNRLNDFDSKSDSEMLEPGVVTALDDIAYSIGDWRHQYPNDPWLPHAYARLLFSYHRAGAVSTPHAQVALSEMQTSYPQAAETSDTLGMIYGADDVDGPRISLFAAVASPAQAPAVQAPVVHAAAVRVPAARVPVARVQAAPAPATPTTSDAWARFDTLRSGASPGGQ
jgi:hypothetical protein